MTIDEWVTFTFNSRQQRWLRNSRYPGTALEAASHCIEFFDNSPLYVSALNIKDIELGFDVIPSIDGYLGLLASPSIPEQVRNRLCDSQGTLFSEFFASGSCVVQGFMWWEWLVGARWLDGPAVWEDLAMCNRLLQTIRTILDMESLYCIKSALHGINEIGPFADKETVELVLDYALSRRGLSGELRQYAIDIRAGQAR